MKKIYLKLSLVLAVIVGAGIYYYNSLPTNEVEELRKQHAKHLANSPFKTTKTLSKKERKAIGLPGNMFNEREWELTMNPATGQPEPEKVHALQEQLLQTRAPGDGTDADWIERGPNNVGGRTRVVFFDPKDNTNKRAFAGAVSGGLWVTDDITTNGGWSLVTGLPSNLSVTCYAIDPNNDDIWYLGSGEQYTFGQAVGKGIYKTTDAGVTWTKVLDVYDFDTDGSGSGYQIIGGIHFINDIVAWDNNGTTEVYFGASTHVYGDASNPTNYLGFGEKGLYRSTNGGTTWTKESVTNKSVNDFEVDANGNLWFTTTNSSGAGDNGGDIYRRNVGNGTSFSLVKTISNLNRTELEASATNANKFYLLGQRADNGKAIIYVTTNAFSSETELTQPNDPDGSVQADDFTRGQAFYDLVIEADPTNDAIVYVGGINLHRSTNSGSSWSTISHWSTFYSTIGSKVHADHQAFTFEPGNSNKAIVAHDGGISYASNLAATGNNLTAIYPVDDNYNVTQFYSGDIAPGSFNSGDYMLAGAQDNGTQLIQNGNTSGPDNGTDISGGDGAYSFYDQVNTDYLITNYVYNNSIRLYDYSVNAYRTINSDNNNDGDFINPSGLDSNLDILYTNGTSGTTRRIYRYSGLENISASGTATKATITNALLTNSPTVLTVSPFTTGSSLLFVGTADGKVLKVVGANSGSGTWSDISGGSFVGSVSDIQFGATENDIFVTFHNYGVTSVWYSSNGGTNWVSKEGDLPDFPVKCILQNPLLPEEVIVGTELGIWKTNNFSAANPTWTQSQNGMRDVKVMDLDLRSSDNTVLATTFGRGMFTGKFVNDVLTAQFTADNTTPNTVQTVTFTDQSTNGPTNWTWSFSPSTVTYQNGTNANSQNPQVTFDAAGTYTVTLTVSDGTDTDDEVKTNYITVSTPSYCDSTFSSATSTDEYIDGVVFGDINNTGTGTVNGTGYSDYTNLSTDVQRGQTYNLAVTVFANYNEYAAVWIDWNQDYVFDNSERYSLGFYADANGNVTNNIDIEIPLTAQLGNTRMRITEQYNVDITGPCTADHANNFGETEDYTLKVIEETLGVNTFSEEGFKIYPTITSDKVFITASQINKKATVSVFDINGRQVLNQDINLSNTTTLDLGSQTAGMYFVNISSETFKLSKKIIKR